MIDKISFTSWLCSLGIHGAIAGILYPILVPDQPGEIHFFNIVWESQPASPATQMPLKKEALYKPVSKKIMVEVSASHSEKPTNSSGKISCSSSINVGARKNHTPLPTYPWICRKRHQEGTVKVSVKLDAEGKVIQAQVYKSSGYEKLDEAAIKAVKSWTMAASQSSKIFSIAFRLNG